MPDAQFAAALSTHAEFGAACDEVVALVRETLGPGEIDLAVCFISHAHSQAWESLGARLRAELPARVLIGCSGESIVGTGLEVEEGPALSLWTARLPGAEVAALRLELEQTAEGPMLVGWPDALLGEWPEQSALAVLGEPHSFPAELLLARMNEDRPGVPVFGGMASGGWQPGQNRLWLDDACVTEGAVGFRLSGAVRISGVVSQGCRPIGQTFLVTKAERNVIFELGGKPPLAVFQQLFDTLSPEEQAQARQGLHVGLAMSEYRDRFRRGDFLVRNVVGADRQTGAIAIGDYVRVGQTVQFHIRDAETADEDLAELLARAPAAQGPQGALLFTCNGRGTRLFDAPHHDAAALEHAWTGTPVAGFFAQGEIGPVGGKCFLHGFTASVLRIAGAPA